MFDHDFEYPKDTLGFHWKMSRAVFGEDSAPTKWLEQKAQESPHRMMEKVVIEESQVVFLLGRMFIEEQKKKDGDKAAEKAK